MVGREQHGHDMDQHNSNSSGDSGLGNIIPDDAVQEGTATLAHGGAALVGAFILEPGNVVSLAQEPIDRITAGGPAMVEQVPVLYYLGAGYLDHLPNLAIPVEHTSGLLYIFWDWYSSYVLSLFLMFYGSLDNIVSWGGFVLLIIRLIADGPRAYRTLKDYVNGKQK